MTVLKHEEIWITLLTIGLLTLLAGIVLIAIGATTAVLVFLYCRSPMYKKAYDKQIVESTSTTSQQAPQPHKTKLIISNPDAKKKGHDRSISIDERINQLGLEETLHESEKEQPNFFENTDPNKISIIPTE
eukprot:gene2957-4967_t